MRHLSRAHHRATWSPRTTCLATCWQRGSLTTARRGQHHQVQANFGPDYVCTDLEFPQRASHATHANSGPSTLQRAVSSDNAKPLAHVQSCPTVGQGIQLQTATTEAKRANVKMGKWCVQAVGCHRLDRCPAAKEARPQSAETAFPRTLAQRPKRSRRCVGTATGVPTGRVPLLTHHVTVVRKRFTTVMCSPHVSSKIRLAQEVSCKLHQTTCP